MTALPSLFELANARITNNVPITETRSRSLILHQRKSGGQAWEMTIRSVILSLAESKSVNGVIASVRATLGTFEFSVPVYSNSQATTTTSTNAIAVGSNTALLGSVTGIAVGDYFNFAGHSKAYVVTEVSGNNITFFPNLQRTVDALEVLTFDGMVFTMQVKGDPLEFELPSSDFVYIELNMVEKL